MRQEIWIWRRFLVALICAISGGVAANESATPASVGKLRSDADQAMVNGDVDKSIKLLNQVGHPIGSSSNHRFHCLACEHYYLIVRFVGHRIGTNK